MPDASQKAPGADTPGLPNSEPAPASAADLTGRTLGEFHILRRLGAGGMGQVYLARQLSLKRQVALKLLRHDLTADQTALKRFQAEAEAVARLNHPNIVQVYGAGEADGMRYMALEFVEGRNLRDHLARKGPPDLPVALSIVRQVATALQKAHDQGIVHRDIKPENILVTKKVEVKVTDFGLSRFFTGAEAVHLTQSGVTLGTPLYLSPEQAQGRAVDHRSDLYSFGVTCYHLLAGEPPFKGSTAVEVALKHVTDQPRPLAELRPDLPPDLCGMVHKMMAKNPDERYQSAREILRDLAKVREGLNIGLTQMGVAAASGGLAAPSGANPTLTLSGTSTSTATASSGLTPALMPSGALPAAPPVRWGRWLVAGVACVLAAAIGAFAYVRFHPPEPPPAPPVAQTTTGLPDIRPSEKLVTTRERELVAVLKDRGTTPDSWVGASVELGLLYLREGRLDEAQARFDAMVKEQLSPAPAGFAAHVAGKFGRAVVAAYRDTDPQQAQQTAKDSIKLFTEAVNTPPPKLPGVGKTERATAVQTILLRHPDLAEAVAEALTRDMVNLGPGQTRLPQPQLEALRSPRGLRKKEKKE